jgi:hypothetical protein
LRSFVSTAKQDDQNVGLLPEIDPVPWPESQPQFHDTLAYWFTVAEVAEANPVESDANPGACL